MQQFSSGPATLAARCILVFAVLAPVGCDGRSSGDGDAVVAESTPGDGIDDADSGSAKDAEGGEDSGSGAPLDGGASQATENDAGSDGGMEDAAPGADAAPEADASPEDAAAEDATTDPAFDASADGGQQDAGDAGADAGPDAETEPPCGDGSDASVYLTGTWVVEQQLSDGGPPIVVTLVIQQQGNEVTGTHSNDIGGYGTLQGTVSGDVACIEFEDDPSLVCGGHYRVVATVEGDRGDGHLEGEMCTGPISMAVTAERLPHPEAPWLEGDCRHCVESKCSPPLESCSEDCSSYLACAHASCGGYGPDVFGCVEEACGLLDLADTEAALAAEGCAGLYCYTECD